MAYTHTNFKTKKALKDAIARRQRYDELAKDARPLTVGHMLLLREFPNGAPREITVFQPNDIRGDGSVTPNGRVFLEGPHYPEAHKWYAEGTMANGILVKVK